MKMAIVVLMTSIITIISILGEAADSRPYKDFPEFTPGIQGVCPKIESTEYLKVTAINSGSSLMVGCASIDHNYNDAMMQSFNLWIASVRQDRPRCHDKADTYPGMKHFHFYCRPESPSPSGDTNNGPMYVRLYGEAKNKTGRPDHRCALYEPVNWNTTTFRMAVSGNSSCDGLSDILTHPQLMMPKSNKGSMLMLSHPQLMIPKSNKGSMLMLLNRARFYEPSTSPPADTTTIEPIVRKTPLYILNNLGSQPNPGSVVKDFGKSSQSYENSNVVIGMATTEHNYRTRPPLSIEVMQKVLLSQFRRKRSLNVNQSYTDISGFSWIQGF